MSFCFLVVLFKFVKASLRSRASRASGRSPRSSSQAVVQTRVIPLRPFGLDHFERF
ncbi:MAG: hypothetical protein V1721_03535 [Pseudomonadota bacterium]